MNERRRVLFVAEAVTLAHVTRPLVLAQALDPVRYELHFACADGYEKLLEELPARRWSIASITPQRFIDALAKGQPIYDRGTLESYLREDLRLLDEIRPDVVVGDFRLSLAVATPLRGVPYFNVVNAHWSPYYVEQRAPFPEHPLGRVLGPELAGALFRRVEPLVFRLHAAPLNRLRRQHGLSALGSLREAYTEANVVLYADTPGLLPCRNLPAHHHYLGPILWSPAVEPPAWWDALPVDRPCIYVTLGSSGAVQVLPRLLAALAALPVSVLLATAGRSQPENPPANVYVADYLPGMAAAGRSALVVSNGGSATAYQALAQGVPVLGLPSNMDQFFTQSAIVRRGAGRLVRPSQATIEILWATVTDLLASEQCRQAAQAVAHEFAQFDAVGRFRALIEGGEITKGPFSPLLSSSYLS